MNKVESLLKNYGPMISGELAKLYEQKYSASNDAARQAISRAKSPVQNICFLSFKNNQKFYYLESQYMSVPFKNAFLEAIEKYSNVNRIYLTAFKMQNGYISKNILPAFTASPVERVKGHKMHSRVIEDLLKTQLIVEEDEFYALNPQFFSRSNFAHSRALEIVKKTIVNDFYRWARGVNLISYHKGKGLTDNAVFAHFQWAFTAPSYISPMFSPKAGKPGFVVADVMFEKTATVDNISFFIEKLKIVRSFKKIPPFLPVLLVDKISPEALEQLKSQNVMVAILNNLYSEKYTALLNELVNVFTNLTAFINHNPQKIEALFNEVAKNEGRYNNLAGDMFELLVGRHYQFIGSKNIIANQKAIDSGTGKYKEVDLIVERDGKIIAVECKGTRSKIGEDFVQKWLNENIPVIRNWLLENYGAPSLEFQLWSAGGFTENALELLEKAQMNTKKYSVKYYGPQQMLAKAKAHSDNSFTELFNRHYNYFI